MNILAVNFTIVWLVSPEIQIALIFYYGVLISTPGLRLLETLF